MEVIIIIIELNLLFVLLLLTAFFRYLVFGAFEPRSFAMIFLLPVTALVLFLISKKFADKERSFQPSTSDKNDLVVELYLCKRYTKGVQNTRFCILRIKRYVHESNLGKFIFEKWFGSKVYC